MPGCFLTIYQRISVRREVDEIGITHGRRAENNSYLSLSMPRSFKINQSR
jgi:hypothetical protein